MAKPDPDGPPSPAGRRGSEPSYRARLMDAIPDLVFVVNQDPELKDWNRAVEEITGYQAGELADRGLEAFFDPGEYPRVEAAVREAFETGETEVEADLVTRDGDRIPYAFTARATEAEGEPVIVGTGRDISERKEKAEALEESERRLREIAENLDAAVWLATLEDDPADSEVLYVSPGSGELFGLSQATVRENPMSFLDLVHPEDVDRVMEAIVPGDSGDRSFEVQYRIQLDDGSIRHIRTEGFPVETPGGQPDRITGISKDVTELREAERELAERQAQLDTILDASPAVLFSLDDEGRFTLSVGRPLEDLGLEPGELVGRDAREVYADRPEIVDSVDRALAGETVQNLVQTEGMWFESRYQPILDGAGEVQGVVGVSFDVTDRIEAQREAAREHHRYAQMLKAAPRCIVHIDGDGRFTYANERAKEILGLEPSDVERRTYNDPDWEIRDLDGNEIPDDQLPFRKVVDRGEVVTDERHTIRWPDGTERVLDVHGAPLFDDEGEVESTVFFLADVTDRLERQREVERERDLRAALFDQNVDPVLEYQIRSGEAVITAANAAFREVFGYEEDEIQGQAIGDVIVPVEGRSQHEDFVQRSLAGEAIQAEVERVTTEGPKEFRLQVVPLNMEGWGPGGYVWYTDLSEVLELEREEAFKARMLDAVGQAVIVTDGESRVHYWNAHAEEMFGWTAEEIEGERLASLMVPDTAEGQALSEEMWNTLNRGETWRGECRVQRKDGTTFPAVVADTPIFGEDGDLERVIRVAYDISDVKETEARLERAQDLARVGDFTHDLRTGERTWSDVLYELFERDPAEGPGDVEWLLDRVHPEDRSKVTSMLEAARQGEAGPFVHDLRMQLGEDEGEPEMRWFNARVVAETDIDGEPIRLQGMMQDVTELRALEREEAFKAHLLDQVGQAVNATDADGTIEYWNEHAEEMFGYSSEEAIGENIYELVGAHEDHVEEILDHMHRGEEWSGELRVERGDGSEVIAVFTKEPLLDEDGNLEGVIGVAYDVTEIRKLEREESLKATMLDQVGEAVIGTDAEGVVTFWNSQAEEVYGYDAEEAVGRQTMELLVPETDEGHDMAMAVGEMLERGETWTGEFESRRKGGSTFPALVSTAPIVRDGEMEGVITVARDISDIKKAQQRLAQTTNQLRARNRELRELSQAAAHEFRTPIWDTTRYLELLERDAGDRLDAEEHEHLETALDGAHRLHDLVESLQDYLDASTREPGLGPVDAGEVVDEVLGSLAETVEETGAEVTVEEPAPELAVDRSSLTEALSHVVENALLFSGGEPPEIEIGFEREDDMWIVSVADQGVGIDPQYQERIFRPFRTLHGRDEGAGPGLGLALTRGIVEAHGGHTWVKSSPGEGTTVYMTFPAAGGVVEGEVPSRVPFQDEGSQAAGGDAGFDDEGPLFE